MRVWLSRTEEFALKSKVLFESEGFSVVIAPLLKVRAVEYALPPKSYDYLIISSLHAACEAVKCQALQDVPVLVVGERSAQYMRDNNFSVLEVHHNVRKLIDSVMLRPAGSRFLHFRGLDVAYEMGDILSSAGYEYVGVIVYETYAAETSCWNDFAAGDVAVFYSAKAMQVFEEKVMPEIQGVSGEVSAIVLSDEIASKCVKRDFFYKLMIALEPSDDGILPLLEVAKSEVRSKNIKNYEKR